MSTFRSKALRQLALQHKDVLIREGLAGDEAVTFHWIEAFDLSKVEGLLGGQKSIFILFLAFCQLNTLILSRQDVIPF